MEIRVLPMWDESAVDQCHHVEDARFVVDDKSSALPAVCSARCQWLRGLPSRAPRVRASGRRSLRVDAGR
eukprot:7053172-Heterocapsa_arctica.AAC.1